MENFVKRYFWIINVVMLTAMAYLTARLASNVVGGKIAAIHTVPKAKAKQRSAPAQRASNETNTWARTIARRNIFNANPPEEATWEEEEPSEEETPSGLVPGPTDECKSSDAKVALVMTMVAEPAEWSMAVLRDTANRTSRLVKNEERLEDRVVTAIYRERLVLANGGAYECVDLGVKGKGKKGAPSWKRGSGDKSRSSKSSSDSAAIKEGVTKTGTNSWKIDREMLNEQLEDLNKLARMARVIPHYRDGKPQGFKLVGVRPGSLYSHIGVRSGDVIKSINDEEISSPNKALELFDRLKNSDSIALDVERRGRKTTLEYTIE